MSRFNKRALGAGLSILMLGSGVASAHHSYTSFDARFLTLTGTVKSYQYTSPHIWTQILVKNPNGSVTEWGLETGSPASMRPMGITPRLLKVGDKVTATIHPKRDGSLAGSLVKLVVPGGRTLNTGDLVTLGAKAPGNR